jgi:hypothetical protein
MDQLLDRHLHQGFHGTNSPHHMGSRLTFPPNENNSILVYTTQCHYGCIFSLRSLFLSLYRFCQGFMHDVL